MKKVKQPTIFNEEIVKTEMYLKEIAKNGYKPWVSIRESKTHGRAHQIYSYKTGRSHKLLSDGEAGLFYILERQPDVIDILEQFPLNIATTMEIAVEQNTFHPSRFKDRKKYNNVLPACTMTTDMLVVRQNKNKLNSEAYNFKYSKSLDSTKTSPISVARTEKKIAIEREYWKTERIKFIQATEKCLNKALIHNLIYLRTFYLNYQQINISADFEQVICQKLFDVFQTQNALTIKQGLELVAVQLNITVQECECIFKKSIYEYKLPVNCYKLLVLDRPLSFVANAKEMITYVG
ncbi:TnsA endonuclease N-terminal domain-containing protein [Flavobacterium sp. W21_SRS_FM6]|uniref:TnsA endonuclease N-terminal domain-containing protein n=1 Tax=Flavobacterium sp. W21_SRS_FM6 TaxID=3240268 RepID=UPI003F8E89BD